MSPPITSPSIEPVITLSLSSNVSPFVPITCTIPSLDEAAFPSISPCINVTENSLFWSRLTDVLGISKEVGMSLVKPIGLYSRDIPTYP